jgi:hypothetical protein
MSWPAAFGLIWVFVMAMFSVQEEVGPVTQSEM